MAEKLPDIIDQCKFNTKDKTDPGLAFADCIDARLKGLSSVESNKDTTKLWEAPVDAVTQLESFGIHWNKKGFEIKGTPIKFDLDSNTKNITFTTGRASVEIVLQNKVGPDDVMVITKNSIQINDNEADLGGGRTFSKIKAALAEQSEKPIAQVQALYDKYGDKGWVGIKGNEGTLYAGRPLSADEIAVSRGIRGMDPIYFLDNGRFVRANRHEENYSPEEFDQYVRTTNHRE